VTSERNPEATRQRILDAAIIEFSKHGLAGARIDAIATRARANKQLIYRYYNNKRSLFYSVIDSFRQEPVIAHARASNLNELFRFFWQIPLRAQGRNWVRLSTWEALELPVSTHESPETLLSLIDDVRALQKAGQLSLSLEPDLVVLAAVALGIYPTAFPQTAWVITGQDTSSDEFRARWEQFLDQLAVILPASDRRRRRPIGAADPAKNRRRSDE
jgi:AcrR family transcriptional regulator